MSETQQTPEETLFELCGYILNCAEMTLSPRGGARYSALRFMEVYSRILGFINRLDCISEDTFLNNMNQKLGAISIEIDNIEQTREDIMKILLDFADESVRRMDGV